MGNRGRPHAAAFSRLSTPIGGQRRVYLRLYSGTLRLRDTALAGREKLKITEMRIPSKGEIVRTDTAYQGEIVILPQRQREVKRCIRGPNPAPRKRWREDPSHAADDDCAGKRQRKENGCWTLLRNLRILTRFLRCEVDSITHEIILSFWAGCSWRLFPLCCRKIQALKQW